MGPAVHAVEELFPDEEGLNEDVLENTVAKTPWAETRDAFPAHVRER